MLQKITLTILLLSSIVTSAQTQFWSDTFEDTGAPSSGSRTPSTTFYATNERYFNRVTTAQVNTTNIYSSFEGSKFFAGADIDNLSGQNTQSAFQNVTWSSINISGKTTLSFKGLFAIGNSSSFDHFPGSSVIDYMIVEYRIDGGAWTNLVRFFPNIANSGSGALALETTGDSLAQGEGVALNGTFTEFSSNISGTGTLLDLRFKCFANGTSFEEIAVDNFRLFEAVGCTNPIISTQPTNKSICFNGNTSFSIVATGASTYQWQENTGSGFTNITNGGVYSGATTPTLSLTGVNFPSGYLYRCIAISSGTCQTNSNSASLTVSAYFNTSSQTNVSCNGGSNGSATLNAAGGIGPYNYSWAPSGGTSATASGLSVGVYTITVTDAISCSTTKTYTITQPSALITSTAVTNVLCNGASTGLATITASGGTSPYTYLWSSAQTTSVISGQVAGVRTVTVTDANGCTNSKSITITQPASALSASNVVTNVLCFGGSTGAINLTPTGGTPAYTFLWSTGHTSEDRTGLLAGAYTCTITDANGCTTTSNAIVTQPASALSASNVVTNVLCFGGSTGAINLTPSGGTPAYTFNWVGGITTEDRTGLLAGPYTCTITDANGCTTTSNIIVTQPAFALSASNVVTNVLCNGGSTGAINLTPTGGTAAYTFNWSGGITTEDRAGLLAGVYTCTITDANGCTSAHAFNVTQSTAIVATITSTNTGCISNTGSASVSASGGTPGYTYSWSPVGGTGITASSLGVGVYTCIIKDANLCSITKTVSVNTAGAPSASIIAQTNVTCNSVCNGAATVTVNGGSSPYTYIWSNGNTTNAAINLCAGVITCTISGSNGCAVTTNTTITQPSALSVNVSASSILCNGGISTITVSATGGSPSYSGVGTFTANASTQTYTVTDTNGCSTTTSISISQPSALSSNAFASSIICNGGISTITVSATGGSPSYSGVGTFTANASTQTYTVTDVNGCTSTSSVSITEPSALLSSQNVTLCAGQSISVGSSTYNASGTYTNVLSGINGCDSTVTTNLTVNNLINITTSLNGLTISANEPSATYQWIDCGNNTVLIGETNVSYTATTNGSYAVVVSIGICSDTSACVNISTVGIKDANSLTGIKLYPNPTNSSFTISGIELNTMINVYNGIGELVKSTKSTTSNTTIDLSDYSNGIYFIKLKNNKGEAIQKLIKQ